MPPLPSNKAIFLGMVGTVSIGLLALWYTQCQKGPKGAVLCLHRYPVKGLWFDKLQSVDLKESESFPADRAWALIRGDHLEDFSPSTPKWLHKSNFHCAFTAGEALATLRTSYDEASTKLTVRNLEGHLLAEGRLADPNDRLQLERLFQRHLKDNDLRIVCATDHKNHQFNNTNAGAELSTVLDHPSGPKVVHLVNLATVKAFSNAMGASLNPLRFRANIIFDGIPPWKEFEWVGKHIQVGGVKMKVLRRTVRCDATTVNLDTGKWDMDVPGLLEKTFPQYGPYLGVYAEVTGAGTITPGDEIYCT